MYSKEQIKKDLEQDLVKLRTQRMMDEWKELAANSEPEYMRCPREKWEWCDHPFVMVITITSVCVTIMSFIN